MERLADLRRALERYRASCYTGAIMANVMKAQQVCLDAEIALVDALIRSQENA